MFLANVAIPTVVPHMLTAVILLPVIAGLEAIIIRRDTVPAYGPAFRAAFGANWRSTLVGLPLGYIFAFAGVVPAGMFASLIPEGSRQIYNATLLHTIFSGGMIPNPFTPMAMAIGQLAILIPYFFASVFIERRYLLRRLKEFAPATISRTAWKMNLLTYALLMLFAIGNLVVVASQRPGGGRTSGTNAATPGSDGWYRESPMSHRLDSFPKLAFTVRSCRSTQSLFGIS